ncbi:MAG TPA: trypsin-like peptidase domain-containing protein [Phycisphaerae bacterium]|nr:trypsin-like peptidase domain-containing protein [Phycisphaerae bacterium]HPZ98695.1 trypsin-like peptidase domain-containing protein [Phycisphaerae bacterium]
MSWHVLTFAISHLLAVLSSVAADDSAAIRQAEQDRIDMIERASRSVVSILAPDESGGGSGVIITPDGYGVTNFHVIMGMARTRRGLGGLSDGKTYPLEVLGIDPTGDLAMFRLTGRDRFDAAPLGDSDHVRVGDAVVALGNPFMLAEDYTPTATFGMVSGVHRYQYGADTRSLVYTDCLQIDASINPGNSGGPLFDMQGRLIGINGRASFLERDRLRQRVNVGVAYAISINQVKRFLPALKEGWLVEHGTLGATVRDTPDGVRFDNVLAGSAADRIGIELGDELIAFDGRPIADANAFGNILGVYPAGWPVTVTYRKDGTEVHRQVALDPLPLTREIPWPKADPGWIRAVATGRQPTTLPYDVTDLVRTTRWPSPPDPAGSVSPDKTAPVRSHLAGLLSPVVKIYGGRIAGEEAYATGVLVSAGGEIVTALALLLEASTLRVVTADGTVHRARVIYRDERRQLALLELQRKESTVFSPVILDESIAPAAGDGVYVVGNPFKIADSSEPCSITHGVLSGRILLDARRPGGGPPAAYRGEVWIMDAMSSQPGAPGSAVFDTQGRFIGLVGEVLESRLTNTLLNYAYPVEQVAAFLREARTPADASGSTAAVSEAPSAPGYHGIRLARFGYLQKLPFVGSVATDSPAARAGIQQGDLIISIDGRAVTNARTFEEAFNGLYAGTEVSVVVKRGNELVTVRLTLEEAPK